MSRVFRRRAVVHFLVGLASFISVIAFSGCSPIPSDAILINGPEPGDDPAGTNEQPPVPPTSQPADDSADAVPNAGGADADDSVQAPTGGDAGTGTNDLTPDDDAEGDIAVAENPPDSEDVAPDDPPSTNDPPVETNPPGSGTGGNPDSPAENPPADNQPVDDPPPSDPPAEEPPAEDPPTEEQPSHWPNNAYCAMSANWDANWAAFEAEVVVLVNQRRAAGANCGSAGSFPPANPLTMNPSLQCAARNHSMDMNVRNFFSHTNPDGQGPGYRITLAGYSFSWWGENIAWGYSSPSSVVNGWMNSPGHCANIMNANFTEIGVGYYSGNYWTQTFGRP